MLHSKKNNRFFEGSTEQNKLLFSHTNGLLCVTNVEIKQQQKAKNDCQKKQTRVDQENETFLDQENGNFAGPRKWKQFCEQQKKNNFTNKKKRKQFYEQENENNALKKKEKTLVFKAYLQTSNDTL